MAVVKLNDSEAVTDKPKIDKNALALKTINDKWKGNGVGALARLEKSRASQQDGDHPRAAN